MWPVIPEEAAVRIHGTGNDLGAPRSVRKGGGKRAAIVSASNQRSTGRFRCDSGVGAAGWGRL